MQAQFIRVLQRHVLPEIGSNAITVTLTCLTETLATGALATIIIWLGEEVPFWTTLVIKDLLSANRLGFL